MVKYCDVSYIVAARKHR